MSSTIGTLAKKKSTSPRGRAEAVLVFLALIWGGTFVVVKDALREVSTMSFLALRFALGTVCMAALFARSFRGMPRHDLWRGLRGGCAAGFLLWLGFAFQTWGLERTTASNSGFLTGFYIVLVPIFSTVIYKRWPRPNELIGIAMAGAGLVLLTAPVQKTGLVLNAGDLLTIGCAIVFAMHLLVLGYFSQRERYEVVAITQVASAALLSAFALLFEPPRIVWHAPVVFAIVLTGIFATALAFALQTWAQQYTTATRTALILSLEPVFAYATAIFVAGEHLTLRSICGGGLILTGILAVELI